MPLYLESKWAMWLFQTELEPCAELGVFFFGSIPLLEAMPGEVSVLSTDNPLI